MMGFSSKKFGNIKMFGNYLSDEMKVFRAC